jgi:hypothetical protein
MDDCDGVQRKTDGKFMGINYAMMDNLDGGGEIWCNEGVRALLMTFSGTSSTISHNMQVNASGSSKPCRLLQNPCRGSMHIQLDCNK